jgi:cellulose biosynthesis protein BcsQ
MNLEEALKLLPDDAPEAVVQGAFSRPFLQALGFGDLEMIPEYPVGKRSVDHAVRKNISDDDQFLYTRCDPYLYMEVKGRTENLGDISHPNYRKAAAQLRNYLLDPNSKSVKWGLLTNSVHAQLFRKHGRVIHPVTPCIPIDDIERVAKDLRQRIEFPKRALIATIYNNKGGVGKTTTTLNLAATLTLLKKRVLVVDFDPNQSDLGDALNLPPLQGKILDVLKSKEPNLQEIITPYKFEHPSLKEPLGFDVLLADSDLVNPNDESRPEQQVKLHALRRTLESVQDEYDYILIDAPPNWRIFAKKAVYAADVVLIPARHDNLHSLQNAGMAISRFIPQMQMERQSYKGEAGPIALPIFMNNAFRVSDAQFQLMHQAVNQIIKTVRKEENGLDLTNHFYPRYRKGHKDLRMISIPYMAYISRADFLHVPAAFAFKTAREQYLNLVKEYFV